MYFCGVNFFVYENEKMLDMEKENQIEEARRYVANAEEVIKKAGFDPELNRYTDGKYVKMAGNTLWNGCLIALDALFDISRQKGRPDIDKYKDAAQKRDKKLLAYIVDGYETMHLHMGYDGTKNKKTCDSGFEYANAIIDYCEKLLPATVCA